MWFIKRFVLLFLLALWAVGAEAATYYVRTGGSDSHSCTSAKTDDTAHAKGTIQGGLSCVTGPGDTVIVHGGTYGGTYTLINIPSVAGTDLGVGAITLRAAAGETVWLNGAINMWVDGSIAQFWIIDGINIDGANAPNIDADPLTVNDNCRIQNLEVKNARHIGILLGANNIQVVNVHSHHHGRGATGYCESDPANRGGQCHGVYSHGQGHLIEGGNFHDNHGSGIEMTYHGGGWIVRNNRVHDNLNHAIMDISGSGPNTVYNNVIYRNQGIGIWNVTANNRIYNNTLYGNQDGITDAAGGSSIRNNIVYNSGGIERNGGTVSNNLCNTTGGGCTLAGNPNFVDAGAANFHLQAGSPAVDAGATMSQIAADFDGKPRPQGASSDIGAYEYGGSMPRPLSAPTNLRIAGR
jgi:parallel beta-helix repeat protein